MSNELIRVCDPSHKPLYRLRHSNKKLFDDLIILCCNDCVNKKPFDQLTRELIQK